jgi:hypothetical protein
LINTLECPPGSAEVILLRSVRGDAAMQNKFAGVNPRNFNSMSVPGLSDEARQAVNAAFDAMSTWRMEMANSNEKNSEQVIDKMAAAARALDGPSKSWMPPAHNCRASPRCRSK